MGDDLERSIAARSDEELYEMLIAHREDWTPEALGLAEQEWKRRDLAPDKLDEIRHSQEIKVREKEGRAHLPLSARQKLLFFIFNFAFSLGIVQIIIANLVFRSRGYEKKFVDSIIWMVYGFIAFLAAFWIPRLIYLAAHS
jgi:hypothetical protein